VKKWLGEIKDYDGHPTAHVTPVPIKRIVSEDFSAIGEGDSDNLVTNSFVMVVEGLYSPGMRILMSRWVNAGYRIYDRRWKGPTKNGYNEYSDSLIRAVTRPGFPLPSDKFLMEQKKGKRQWTPDILLGKDATATRYESSHNADCMDAVEFFSSQFIRTMEKQFLMERVKELENVEGSRVQLYKQRFHKEEMFPVFMGATLSPFTDSDDCIKYETYGGVEAQGFGKHCDSNNLTATNCMVNPADLVVMPRGLEEVVVPLKKFCLHWQGPLLNCPEVAEHRVQESTLLKDLKTSFKDAQGVLVNKDYIPRKCSDIYKEKVIRWSSSMRGSRPVDHPLYELCYPAVTRFAYEGLIDYTKHPYDICQQSTQWKLTKRKGGRRTDTLSSGALWVTSVDIDEDTVMVDTEKETDPNTGTENGGEANMGDGGAGYVHDEAEEGDDGGGKPRAIVKGKEGPPGALFKQHFGNRYGVGAQYKSLLVPEILRILGYQYNGETVAAQSPLCESMEKAAALQELLLRGCVPFTVDENGNPQPRCNVLDGSTMAVPGATIREDAVRASMGQKKKGRASRNSIVSNYAMMMSQPYRAIFTRVASNETDVVYEDRPYQLWIARKAFYERMVKLFEEENTSTIGERFKIVMEHMDTYPWAYHLEVSAAGGGDKILGQYPDTKTSIEAMGPAHRAVSDFANMTKGDNLEVNQLWETGHTVQLYLNLTQYEGSMLQKGTDTVTVKKEAIKVFEGVLEDRASRAGSSTNTCGSGAGVANVDAALEAARTAGAGGVNVTGDGGTVSSKRKGRKGKKGRAKGGTSKTTTEKTQDCSVGCLGLFEVLQCTRKQDMNIGMFLASAERLPFKSHQYLTWMHNGHSFFKLREVYNPVVVAVMIATNGEMEKFFIPDSKYLKLCESKDCGGESRGNKNRCFLESDVTRQFVRYACGAGLRTVTKEAEFLTQEKTLSAEGDEDEHADEDEDQEDGTDGSEEREDTQHEQDGNEQMVRYGAPTWENSVWSQLGMDVNTLVESNGYMPMCFDEEDRESRYYQRKMKGTHPDEVQGSFQLAGGEMVMTNQQALLYMVQTTVTSVGRYLGKSLYHDELTGVTKTGPCFRESNRPLPIVTRIYPVSSPTEVYDPTTMLLINTLQQFAPAAGFTRSGQNPGGPEDWTGRLVLDLEGRKREEYRDILRYYMGLSLVTRIVSNVAVYEEYTKYLSDRGVRGYYEGKLIVVLPSMEELISQHTFFDFLTQCFGEDDDKFYRKCGGFQFDGEMPVEVKTVRGFRSLFNRIVRTVMTDDWINKHHYAGEPLVVTNGEELRSKKERAAQQKILEDMSRCFVTTMQSLEKELIAEKAKKREKENMLFLLQKIMEDVRKVMEEPFGFVSPLTHNWTKEAIYAGSGGRKGATLVRLVQEYQNTQLEEGAQ